MNNPLILIIPLNSKWSLIRTVQKSLVSLFIINNDYSFGFPQIKD